MNRIDTLFQKKDKNILSIYFTAGHPKLTDTVPILQTLEASGVDMVEIGMPFSDPMADGPVIQQSSQKALENGMSIKTLFHQLKEIRKTVSIPLILMGYLNPVMQFGIENFLKKAHETGIDGVILPDLPLNLYEESYQALFETSDVRNVFLITPQTSTERIKKIDEISKGFIYMVAAASTTGAKEAIKDEQESYFKRVHNMNLTNPCIIGFGISNADTFNRACRHANGAIIGSAFVKALEEPGPLTGNIQEFIQKIKR